MKIMFVIPTISGGGAERVVTLLANEISKDNQVCIYTLEKGKDNDYGLKHDIKVITSGYEPVREKRVYAIMGFILGYRKIMKSLISCTKAYKPDLVVSFLHKADFVTFFIRKRFGFVWIASERNDPWVRSAIERTIMGFILKRTNCLVCQTKKVAEYYKKIGGISTCVIPNPIDTTSLKNSGNTLAEIVPFALAVGRLSKQKNYPMMIRAFAEAIKETGSNLRLVILGEGSLKKKLLLQTEKYDMCGNILLLGRKTNVFDYMLNADFFIMSSDYEGMPNALLEAMQAGLPVICTDFDTGAASELIDQKNGFLIPVGDCMALKNSIIQLINMSKEQRTDMGNQSKAVLEGYSSEIVFTEWKRLMKSMLDKAIS